MQYIVTLIKKILSMINHSARPIVLAMMWMNLILTGCTSIQSAWQNTQKMDSMSAFRDFLQQYPNSEYTEEANKQMQRLHWLRVRQEDKLFSYEFFMRTNPQSPYTNEARQQIERLEWEALDKKGNLEDYKKFLQKYPDGAYHSQAQEAIHRIEKENENKAYAAAMNSRTYAGMQSFLTEHPNNEHKNEIEVRLKRFITKKTQQPTIIPYKELEMPEPMTGEEIEKRSSASSVELRLRSKTQKGSFIASPGGIFILKKVSHLYDPAYDVEPGRVIIKPLFGGYIIELTSLDDGFYLDGFNVILPEDIELLLPENEWVWWGTREFRGSKVYLRAVGLEIPTGSEFRVEQ